VDLATLALGERTCDEGQTTHLACVLSKDSTGSARIFPRCIEGRIGEEPHPSQLQDCGRPADDPDAERTSVADVPFSHVFLHERSSTAACQCTDSQMSADFSIRSATILFHRSGVDVHTSRYSFLCQVFVTALRRASLPYDCTLTSPERYPVRGVASDLITHPSFSHADCTYQYVCYTWPTWSFSIYDRGGPCSKGSNRR